MFNHSEYVWRDPGGGRPVDGSGRRSFYGSELCGPGGAPVAVPRDGVSRAAAAGAAGETAAAAEAAAAGETGHCPRFQLMTPRSNPGVEFLSGITLPW